MIRSWGSWGRSAAAVVVGISLLAPISPGNRVVSAASAPSTSSVSPSIQIVLDNYPLPFDSAPKIDNGVTLVPFRTIAEALGIAVVWDAASKTVVATGNDASGQPAKVVLTIGKKSAQVNGQAVELTAAPVVQQGRVLIPMAFFGRQFGAQVSWESATKTVRIQSPKREMRTMGFYAISSYDQASRLENLNSAAFGWAQINQNGEFSTTDKDYKWPKADGDVTPESIAARVEDSYLMVHGLDGNRQTTKVLTDPAARDSSIQQMVSLAKDKGFKGVMLDYEGLGWKDDPATAKKQFNEYTALLSEQLKKEGLKLSLALPPLNGAYQGYDYKTLAGYADEIVIMAYLYVADKTPEPMNKVDAAISLALGQGVPKQKLLLGIDMENENETTVLDKIGLAKRYDLSGVAFWRLGILTQAEMKAIDSSVTKIGG